MEQRSPTETSKERAEAKRQRAACSSSTAYDRLKSILFDKALREHAGGPANLDSLAGYSVVRMENPIVTGSDPALDITRCKGNLVLQIPPGAERAFGGERYLRANIDYTAQPAADGSGFVYLLWGGEPIVARLTSFNMTSMAYRPPPAIDDAQVEPDAPVPVETAQADLPATPRDAAPSQAPTPARQSPPPGAREATFPSRRASVPPAQRPKRPLPDLFDGEDGEGTVRAFYVALAAGDGATASAHIIAEKQANRAFSPEAMSRFYGGLPQPIQLTGIAPASRGKYRMRYRYSAGRSRCNGSAVVSMTNRNGREFIRSIRALDRC